MPDTRKCGHTLTLHVGNRGRQPGSTALLNMEAGLVRGSQHRYGV